MYPSTSMTTIRTPRMTNRTGEFLYDRVGSSSSSSSRRFLFFFFGSSSSGSSSSSSDAALTGFFGSSSSSGSSTAKYVSHFGQQTVWPTANPVGDFSPAPHSGHLILSSATGRTRYDGVKRDSGTV